MIRSTYLRRFLILLTLCVIFTAAGSMVLNLFFARDSYSSVQQDQLTRTLAAGEALLTGYSTGIYTQEDLAVQVNAVTDTSGAFYVLADEEENILARTESAGNYLSDHDISSFIRVLPDQAMLSVNVESAAGSAQIIARNLNGKTGFVICGLPGAAYARAADALYSRMLLFLPVMMLVILLVGLLLTGTAARPALQLIQAANRIRSGELASLPENMPGETGEIARAMNMLTSAVSEALEALRHEKETVQLVIEGLSEGVIAVDSAGSVIQENTAAKQLLCGKDSEEYRRVLSLMRERKEPVISEKLTLNAGRVLLCTVTELPLRENTSAGRAALIRDITEQERLERTRYDYVANISHELRTPLASIRGLGEGLRDGLVTKEEDRTRYYSIIVDEVTRLSRLVNDLLELSGLQSNPAGFETETVDLNSLVWDLEDLNRSLFDEKGIRFEKQLPEEELPEVLSNEDRLSEVLTILLDNARKYTPEGGEVTLGAERTADGVRMYVKDTGIGMDAETKAMAFERFHRAEKSHSGNGSGLGLAIAREIMKKLGPEIQVESEPGKGSVFSFVLPV